MALTITLSACAVLTESASSPNAPPSDLVYAANPASYVYGSTITSNEPTSARPIVKYTITPSLPPGLTFDETTGVISGTPTTITPAASYTIQATNSYGSAFIKLQLAITDLPPTISYGGTTTLPYTVGTAIAAITPTLGGGATVSCQSTPSLPAGLSLSSQCVLTGTPTAAASTATTYNITAINSGGSAALPLLITVTDILPAFTYTSLTFSLIRGQTMTGGTPISTGGVITSCSSSPTLPAGLALSSTCEISGAGTAIAASTSYTLTGTNSGGTFNRTITLDVHDSAPVIAYTPTSHSFIVNRPITTVSPASTGGYIESCTASPTLPAGLSLSSSCVLSGTPTTIGATAAYTISATNTAGTANATVNLAVTAAPPTIRYMGSPYTYTHGTAITSPVVILGGGTPTACTSSPTLPTGLSINATNCVISGTPTVSSIQTNYVITATNSGGSATWTISIKINTIAPNLTYADSPYSWEKGVTISTTTPTNTGGAPTNCTASPTVPAGISLSPTCVLTGAPTAVSAATTYAITAVNSVGSSSKNISITVNDSRPAISYSGSPFTYTKDVAVSTLTAINTGGTVVSCASSPTLPTGLSLSSICEITGTPNAVTAAADYTITATNSGGNGTATINIRVNDVAPSIAYTGSPFTYTKSTVITTLTPSNSGGTITGCSSSPTLPAGLSINTTTCDISGTPTAVNPTTSYTITATNSGGSNGASISITINDALPALTYAGAPFTFVKGSAITTQTPTNSGGSPTSCSSSPALPAGLSINGTTCAIAGTPTVAAATTSYSISATNTAGTTSLAVSITVNDVAPSISFAGSPFIYTKGSAIATLTPTSLGGTVTSCAASPPLPAGLSLSATCVLTGTPTVVAAATAHTITATNSGGTSAPSIDITVKDILPSISFPSAPYTFAKNVTISSQTPANSGGAVTSCATSPALPAGLSLSTACVISGTPTAVTATASYTITATNSGGSATGYAVSITINDPAPVIAYPSAPFTFTKNVAITTKTPTNSGGAITGCSSSPALPAGLTLSATCDITGTPTGITAGASYTITATNSGGASAPIITVTVNDAAPSIDYIPTSYSFTYTKASAISTLTPNNGGGPIISCSSSPTLPAGLSLNATTCAMTGTPSVVVAATTYTISAANTGGTSAAVITITVTDAVPTLNYAGAPFTFAKSSAITTQTPVNSGGTITSCSASPSLPAGLSLSNVCVITGTPTTVTAPASYVITATNTGGTITDTIDIEIIDIAPTLSYAGSPLNYPVNTAIATLTPTNSGGAITSCSSSPALPAGLSLSTACVLTGTPSSPSTATAYTITATNSGGTNSDTLNITVAQVAPAITYAGSPLTYINGNAISTLTPSNTGGSITSCGVSPALPAGLSLSTACVLSGTPSATSGATSYTITATNAAGSGNTSISIAVNNVAPSLTFSPSTVAEPIRTAISTRTPINTGGTTTSCSSSPALPTGLSLSTACVITGTPTVLSAATVYTITGTNTGGTGSATISIEIKNLPQIAFYGLTDVTPGTWNGAAPSSNNIWKATQDGVSITALTINSNASLESIYPSWIADGTSIVHTSRRAQDGSTDGTSSTSYNIWTSTPTGTSPAALTANTNANLSADDPPVYSPDGTKIVFASKAAIDGSDNGTAASSYNIFVANADGSGTPLALTQNTNASLDSRTPVWSPDGTMVYFSSLTATDGTWNGTATLSNNIWRINATGTGLTALSSETVANRDSLTPAVSPDGLTVLYSSRARIGATAASSYNIWVMNFNGTSKTSLTSNTAASLDSTNPNFSPDGAQIVFQSKMAVAGVASSSHNIWTMDASGLNQVALTTNTAASKDSQMPSFSPDSTKIVFYSRMNVGASVSSSNNIFVINADGTGSVTAVTQNTSAGLDSLLGPHNVWFAP